VIHVNFWEKYPDLYRGLEMVESRLRQEARSRNATIESILFRLVNAGGKRLRPVLVLLCGGYGGVDQKRLVPLAAAVEMVHMATLVHDDVIDDADYRRGIETTHRKWDNHTAIFAGDYMLSKAFQMLTQYTEYRDASMMAKTFKLICEGEIEQYFTRNSLNISIKKYLTRIRYKTAMLFAMSCYLGASQSTIPDSQKRALVMYGMNLGMAFQIVDDLLDFKSSGEELGKPVTNDVRQGVYTLPVIYALKDKGTGERLKSMLSDEKKPEHSLEEIVELVKRSGAVERAELLQQRYHDKAKKAIRHLATNTYTDALQDLLLFTAARTK
jgi:heptaprenyl diphosphate synthase